MTSLSELLAEAEAKRLAQVRADISAEIARYEAEYSDLFEAAICDICGEYEHDCMCEEGVL